MVELPDLVHRYLDALEPLEVEAKAMFDWRPRRRHSALAGGVEPVVVAFLTR